MYGIERNFGNVPADYNESEFLSYVSQISDKILLPGGLYMPCLLKKTTLEQINYYPEGNIVPGTNIFNPEYAVKGQDCIPGDQVFVKKLNTLGITHWTDCNSIVYHFQEGEMRDSYD